jgi:hypothetical protein
MAYYVEPKKNTATNANKFVKVIAGIPAIVQVIDADAVQKWQHWLTDSEGKKASVRCLGKAECPVCAKNALLGPDGWKNPSFNKIQKRYMVNVVNLTPVKRGSDGEPYLPMKDKNDKLVYPATDAKGNSLVDVKAESMNEVQILERGPELFAQLDALNNSVVDPKDADPINGAKLGLTHFAIQLMAKGEGREMKVSVTPLLGSPLTINPDEYQDKKIDLNAGFAFTTDEVQAILDGVKVSDILAARAAQEAQTQPAPAIDYNIK